MAVPAGMLRRNLGYLDLARQARKATQAADAQVRENARLHLVERMGRLRGLPQKIGQMLSLSDDEDQARAFAPLTDRAEALPFDQIQPLLEQAWNAPLDAVVTAIDPQGLAASLGQVHRATLPDGRTVAVKVRYPGIRRAVLTDLKTLGWLSVPVGDLRRGFDLHQYRAEIARNLDEELDYRTEARHQHAYREHLSAEPGWKVPGVVTHLSTDDVLVSEWVDGDRIEAVEDWPVADRSSLARTLIRGFCRMLFKHGQIHADPHPGNYRFARAPAGPEIVLYDFGSVAPLSLQHRLALMKLIQMTAVQQGDPYPQLIALGFDPRLLGPIREKLPAVCTVLFEPFSQPVKFNLDRWQCSQRLADVLGDDRWNFRMAGPAHLLLILRAFRGLTYYLNRLGQDVSWYHALRPHLAEHESALAAVEPHSADASPSDLGTLAKTLRIRVTQNGSTKVALTFPALAVEDIGDLIDDQLARRIRDRGIDLQAIVRRARASAYRPQELFTLDEHADDKCIRTWLE
ncbi:MAG: ABC1 kinase family protein [Phycisphaerae bacterium]